MNKPYFSRNLFLIDRRHKRLKNTIDLLLFYGEHFYGFSESVMKSWKVYKITYTITGQSKKAPEVTWVLGGGIELSCRYFLYGPKIRKRGQKVYKR